MVFLWLMGVLVYYNAKMEVDLDATLLDTPTGYPTTSPHPDPDPDNRKGEQSASVCRQSTIPGAISDQHCPPN